jgi:O-antigen ligase
MVGMLVNIAVSFNRNMWVGLGVGLLLMLVLSGPLVRRRLAAAIAVIAVLLAILPSQLGSEEKLTPLIKRGTSLTNPESLQAESSLKSRANETDIAIDVALDHPVIGIGPGVDFNVSFIEATGGGNWVRVPQLFLHNQYLYLMLIAGIPALAAFLVYLLSCLSWAWHWRTRTPEMSAWGVGLFSIMLSSFVAIYFSATDMVFALALLTGAIFVTRNDREGAEGVG